MRDDIPQGVRGKVLHAYDVPWVYFLPARVYFLPASRAIVPILRHRRGAASNCVNSRAKRPAPATPRPLANAIISYEPTYSGIALEDLSGTRVWLPAGTST